MEAPLLGDVNSDFDLWKMVFSEKSRINETCLLKQTQNQSSSIILSNTNRQGNLFMITSLFFFPL